ncbi:MAG TPA: hypothetical protein VJ801_15850 [Polyangia bacterium]|nr:hypothetical protein [Polyangia bacterium]
MRKSFASVFAICGVLVSAGAARATPSTTYWAPSTTYVQPYLVPHITYDTYFWKGPNAGAAASPLYPIDTGITIGVLPFEKLQLELGYDLLLPTENSLLFLLNAKLGTPEGTFFTGSPSLAAGIFGVGIKGKSDSSLGTSYDVLYGQIQKNLPWGGYVSVGGYYGAGTKELWLDKSDGTGKEHRAGFIGAVASPDIPVDLPGLKKLLVVADAQTGNNIYGAVGGGLYLYFTDTIDILTGPVYFFDADMQPGGKHWMWTVQLDVDIPFKAAPPAPAPAAAAASEPTLVAPAAPAPAAPPVPSPPAPPGTE